MITIISIRNDCKRVAKVHKITTILIIVLSVILLAVIVLLSLLVMYNVEYVKTIYNVFFYTIY